MPADQLVGLRDDLLGDAVAEPLATLDHKDVRAERRALDHGQQDCALLAFYRLQQPFEHPYNLTPAKTCNAPRTGVAPS